MKCGKFPWHVTYLIVFLFFCEWYSHRCWKVFFSSCNFKKNSIVSILKKWNWNWIVHGPCSKFFCWARDLLYTKIHVVFCPFFFLSSTFSKVRAIINASDVKETSELFRLKLRKWRWKGCKRFGSGCNLLSTRRRWGSRLYRLFSALLTRLFFSCLANCPCETRVKLYFLAKIVFHLPMMHKKYIWKIRPTTLKIITDHVLGNCIFMTFARFCEQTETWNN